MLKLPGLTGYHENVVLSLVYNDIQGEKRYQDVAYDMVPIDAVIEMYFNFSEQSIEKPLENEGGKAVCLALNAICENAASYLMNEYQIM